MGNSTGNGTVDERFGFGLFARVARVLEDHGYEQPDDAQDKSRAWTAFLEYLRLAVLAYEGVDTHGLADSVVSAPMFVGLQDTNSGDVPVPIRLEDGTIGYLATVNDLDRVIAKLRSKGRD